MLFKLKRSSNKLILVGAGPGDPELITLKALKALKAADVILYDSLVDTGVFKLAFGEDFEDALPELIFTGKRRKHKSIKQEQIHALILEHLALGKNVLRLKGGDPFIFARGVEEAQIANDNGFAVEIIPGLTSGLSIPGLNGVALTLRQKSHGVTLATGHEFDEEKLAYWIDTLKAGYTLVIYMGLFKSAAIIDAFKEALAESFPCIAIQNGSLPSQKIINSNLGNLAQDLIDEAKQDPTLLIFGEYIKQEIQLTKIESESFESFSADELFAFAPGIDAQ